MGFFERAKLAATDLAATGKVAKELPKFLSFGSWSLGRCVRLNAENFGDRPAVAYLDQRITWSDVNAKANRYADFFRRQGITAGDVVALLMDNRPDFLFAQTALSKLGAVTAMINTNLTGSALIHAINIGEPRAVIVGSEHQVAIEAVRADLKVPKADRDLWYVLDDGATLDALGDANMRVINDEVALGKTAEPTATRKLRTDDPCCYIYTSGTTGLPKAAVVTNQRFMLAGTAFGKVMHDMQPDDVVYITLPLYHSSAQWAGWGACVMTGACAAIRRKFSASNFWSDVSAFGATRFIYIGECCRYLMNQPPHPDERSHNLKVGVGNGLRPDIWEKFQERFGIPLIREFYGATEGNAPMMNVHGRPGMVGRLRPGQVILRCDPATGDVIRNAKGFCEKVKEGETGLLVGKINRVTRFDGYVNAEATSKKIFQRVFKKGDQYFNSGDLLTLHENAWVSFADRVGDTFRWKGENVSTNEVAEILNAASGVLESNVYGVQVPGTDGRAGMASLNVDDAFSIEHFASYVTEKLPGYQRPQFVRLQHDMRITGTFKHQKVDYRKEGYDPAKTQDPMFFLDADGYVPIDHDLFQRLQAGEVAPR